VRYKVQRTVEVQAKIDSLEKERAELLEKGLGLIAENPYREHTFGIDAEGNYRKVRITNYIDVEYVVIPGAVVIVVFRVFDDKDVLL
jgi:mRNA-degrading endonuclease RelE of RelBE toxin-antitoxin system